MSLFVIVRSNPILPRSSYIYRYDQGFQQVRLVTKGRRTKLELISPILIPHHILEPYIIPVGQPGQQNFVFVEGKTRFTSRIDVGQSLYRKINHAGQSDQRHFTDQSILDEAEVDELLRH